MNRLVLSTVACFAIISLQGCMGGSAYRSQLGPNTKDFITEGWLDDDTFQCRAIGAPNPDAKGKVRKMTQACEAAKIMAQYRIVELMVGVTIEGAANVDSGELGGIAISKEFAGTVKGGAIIRTSHDDELNCEVTYRLHKNGLRKLAEAEVGALNS